MINNVEQKDYKKLTQKDVSTSHTLQELISKFNEDEKKAYTKNGVLNELATDTMFVKYQQLLSLDLGEDIMLHCYLSNKLINILVENFINLETKSNNWFLEQWTYRAIANDKLTLEQQKEIYNAINNSIKQANKKLSYLIYNDVDSEIFNTMLLKYATLIKAKEWMIIKSKTLDNSIIEDVKKNIFNKIEFIEELTTRYLAKEEILYIHNIFRRNDVDIKELFKDFENNRNLEYLPYVIYSPNLTKENVDFILKYNKNNKFLDIYNIANGLANASELTENQVKEIVLLVIEICKTNGVRLALLDNLLINTEINRTLYYTQVLSNNLFKGLSSHLKGQHMSREMLGFVIKYCDTIYHLITAVREYKLIDDKTLMDCGFIF